MSAAQLRRFLLLSMAVLPLAVVSETHASPSPQAHSVSDDSLAPDRTERASIQLPVDGAWTRWTISRAEQRRLPFRSVFESFTLFPSVVSQEAGAYGPGARQYFAPFSHEWNATSAPLRPLGSLNDAVHVRGGRTGELTHFIDGVPATNRFFNSPLIESIPEALEEVELHAGPSSAAHGQGLSGMSLIRLRTGGDHLEVSAQYLTDNLARSGQQFLGTSTFGFQSLVGTVGGPIPLKDTLRFFVAARHFYQRDRQAMYLDPFRFDSLRTDVYHPTPGRLLPGPLVFLTNAIPGNRIEENTFQGNLTYASRAVPLRLRLTASYQSSDATIGTQWPDALIRYYNQRRLPEGRERSVLLGVSGGYSWKSTTLDARISWQRSSFDTHDPDFGNTWQLFSDSAANAAAGYRSFVSRWQGPPPYTVINNFVIAHEEAPTTAYRKDEQVAWLASAAVHHRYSDELVFTAGASVEWWTMRLLSIPNVPLRMQMEFPGSGGLPAQFPNAQARRFRLASAWMDHYGYSVDGNSVDDGFDAPRSPSFGAAYLQARYTAGDFSAGVGLRFERIALGIPVPADVSQTPFDASLPIINESLLADQASFDFLSPRADLAYALGPATTLKAAAGRYVGVPALNQLYHGSILMSRTVDVRSGGNAYLTPVPWVTKPEKAVHLELGVEHRFPGALSLTLTLYRKSYTDLLAVRDLVTPGTSGFVASSFNAFTNDARATAAGVEVDVDYHPPSGFFGRLQYAHSAARGSDSYLLSALGKVESSRSPSGIASADPFPTTPLEYQRTHRATAILGYSGPVDPDDPFLSGFGIAALVSFSSGHPYTPEQAIRFTDGSSTPWNMGVSYLHDPRAVEAAGPQNSATTPSVFGIDLALSKEFAIGPVRVGLFLHVLNLLDTRADLNVYPRTGTATDDGFLSSPTGMSFAPVPGYADFYRTINNANRWAYMSSVGNDLYNHPRQIRVGVRVSL